MQVLINELKKFFQNGNKNLKDFLDNYKEIIQTEKIFFKKEHYQGTYVKDLFYRDNNFEVVLITWGAKCETSIHCHPKNGCLLTVLDGTLIEERYDEENVLYKYSKLKVKDFGYMHCDLGKHRIINKNDYNCYSLHIYSPPCFYDKN